MIKLSKQTDYSTQIKELPHYHSYRRPILDWTCTADDRNVHRNNSAAEYVDNRFYSRKMQPCDISYRYGFVSQQNFLDPLITR